MSYNDSFKQIEKFSKNQWLKYKISESKIDLTKEKEVVLDFFPYPSGVGLHVGHTLGYIATDIYARFQKLLGKNVLYAMGFDAFGLPAEQFAIENGIHPEVITKQNIENISKQLDLLGLNHDKNRTFSTTDSNYYKWTQFIFLKLFNSYFDEEKNKAMPIDILQAKLKEQGVTNIKEELDKHRLAYLDEVKVNWCPKLGTVLSQEEVIGGVSERGGHPVIQKPLRQWVLRITKYSQRLCENLEHLDWPESVKLMQKNWIGLSNGYEIDFDNLKIFTTRPETIDGVTFCAISIEHPMISSLCKCEKAKKFVQTFDKEKIEEYGIFTGSYVINPINKKKIPVYIADYVLPYGCAAIMGVPCDDDRDKKFASIHKLDVVSVFENKGILHNGNTIKQEIINLLKYSWVKKKTYTRLRDWIFSRQRYWGEPFPIVLDKNGSAYALQEDQLPVKLPYLDDYKFDIESKEISKPLDKAHAWKSVKFIKIDESTAKIVNENDNYDCEVFEGVRETNTMPNWAGSCWYYLRYMDNLNDEKLISNNAKNYWESPKKIGAVDLYLGGAEHAVLHLLYARFWHMVLFDLGFVSSPEPFQKLFNQGMILGPAYKDALGKYYAYKDVEKKDGKFVVKGTNQELFESIGKIGKRYKNGVTPEEICSKFSIDALRLFMMFLGPLEQNKPWDHTAIKGMSRLLEKVFALKVVDKKMNSEILNIFNETALKMEKDINSLKFNTAISSFNILINKLEEVNEEFYEKILIIFAPFAPHLCEFLYSKIKLDSSIFLQKWPILYEKQAENNERKLIITNNGKKLDVQLIKNLSKEEVEKLVEKLMQAKKIVVKKIILIENKNNYLANVVS